jgi:hypothetical protein
VSTEVSTRRRYARIEQTPSPQPFYGGGSIPSNGGILHTLMLLASKQASIMTNQILCAPSTATGQTSRWSSRYLETILWVPNLPFEHMATDVASLRTLYRHQMSQTCPETRLPVVLVPIVPQHRVQKLNSGTSTGNKLREMISRRSCPRLCSHLQKRRRTTAATRGRLACRCNR